MLIQLAAVRAGRYEETYNLGGSAVGWVAQRTAVRLYRGKLVALAGYSLP